MCVHVCVTVHVCVRVCKCVCMIACAPSSVACMHAQPNATSTELSCRAALARERIELLQMQGLKRHIEFNIARLQTSIHSRVQELGKSVVNTPQEGADFKNMHALAVGLLGGALPSHVSIPCRIRSLS